MESMKDKVAIVGMGCSAFGELWDKSVDDMIVEACSEAFEDAGVGQKDIQAAYVGTVTNYTGTAVTRALKFQYIPVTRVENECGTGEDVIRNAAFALAARAYDLVLVVAYEKLKDYGYPGLPIEVTKMPGIHPVYETTLTAPGNYALAATRYFDRYGLSREEGKRTLAKISVKSHYNGARNPRAHLRREVTI
ncbi:MAG: acetyl-CoA acetyltransferase, partial [Thermodesulfobacteriota bacterium]|nr:acetyl-CoA acetyltransferase [Thermodesulfobacteriota bacterium]